MLCVAVSSAPACFAIDQVGLTGEFSLPDRSHSLVDSQDDYYDAVQRLQDADAAVVRARESAMKQQQSAPQYDAAVKAVDQAYHAFNDKKERGDRRFGQEESGVFPDEIAGRCHGRPD